MPDPLCLFVGSPSPPSTAPMPGKHLEFHSLLIKDQTQRGTQIQLQVAIQSKWPGELSYYNSCSYCHLMSILSSDKVICRSFVQLTQQVCDVDVFTQKPILTGSQKETQTTFRKGKGRRLMTKTILNFHFDYLHPSLKCYYILMTMMASKTKLYRWHEQSKGGRWHRRPLLCLSRYERGASQPAGNKHYSVSSD